MRLAFFGASAIAVPSLQTIIESHYELLAVVVPPAAPAGRGLHLRPTPVEEIARAAGLPVYNPLNPNDPSFIAEFDSLELDLAVLVAFGAILKPELLAAPAHGFINLHPSLLPRWRGPAPIPRTLMAGDDVTGITIIRLNEKIDAGNNLAQEALVIGHNETAGELTERLALIGSKVLMETLHRLSREEIPGTPQDPKRARYAPKVRPSDRPLDWNLTAEELHNRVRALSPEPGAITRFRDQRLLILRTRLPQGYRPGQNDEPSHGEVPPGSLITDHKDLFVRTGDHKLELLELQPESGRRQSGRDFRNGARLKPGERLT